MADNSSIIQLTWQERVVKIYEYHCSRLRESRQHRIADTAKELNRSLGSVSEDITLASWMRTHPRVAEFRNPRQALDYIKEKKRKLMIGDL